MAVTLAFTYQKLTAINEAWVMIQGYHANTPKERAMLSVMQELALKFQKKQLSLQFKHNPKKQYKMELKDHEAYFLEQFLRDILYTFKFGYAHHVLSAVADYLNQKLA